MILPIIEKMKYQAIQNPLVNMSSFGSLSLYENKSTIAYPYVNFDVVSASVEGFVKTYTIRMYVMDKNLTPYSVYNKTEVILDDLLKQLEIENYNINYFTLNFKDIVDGVWTDFEYETKIEGNCVYQSLFSHELLEDGNFRLLEDGSLIILNI